MPTTRTKAKIRVARTFSGAPAPVMYFPEAASQSFAKGDPVYLVAGKVTICPDDPTVVLGIAEAPATGTTNTPIPVTLATADVVFEGSVNLDGDGGSDNVIAQANVGLSHGLVALSGTHYIDPSTSSNNVAVVIGPGKTVKPDFADSSAVTFTDVTPQDPIADIYARVEFVIETSAFQLNGGASSND